MTTDAAVELCRSMVLEVLLLAGPVLLAGLLIGLIVSLLQAVTQLHDQTLSLVPKLTVMSVAILYLLPWGLSRLAEYASDLIRSIPNSL